MGIMVVGLAVLTLVTPPFRAGVTEAREAQVRRAIAKALPSVVAVSTGIALPDRGPYRSMASGVIISADGLVLSQHHVTHASDRNDPTKSHPAGRKARVVLHDGREVEAELLGTDMTRDLSMLKSPAPARSRSRPLIPSCSRRWATRSSSWATRSATARTAPPSPASVES